MLFSLLSTILVILLSFYFFFFFFNDTATTEIYTLSLHDALPTSCDMRAPSAATGVYALECAMDELAVALKIDPLDLRLRCYSDRDQHTDRPYSSKSLRGCYRQGAE